MQSVYCILCALLLLISFSPSPNAEESAPPSFSDLFIDDNDTEESFPAD